MVERVGEDRDPSFVKWLASIRQSMRSLNADMARTGYRTLDWPDCVEYEETDRRLVIVGAQVVAFSRAVQDHAPFT